MMYRRACRSGSFCSKTLRLVWSRMILLLMKQPMSSFAGRKGANLVMMEDDGEIGLGTCRYGENVLMVQNLKVYACCSGTSRRERPE